jgi:hypothetical protein
VRLRILAFAASVAISGAVIAQTISSQGFCLNGRAAHPSVCSLASGGYEMSGRIIAQHMPIAARCDYAIVNVHVIVPAPSCPDLDGSGIVDANDLILAIAQWGRRPGGAGSSADLNGDGLVDVHDLRMILNAWLE